MKIHDEHVPLLCQIPFSNVEISIKHCTIFFIQKKKSDNNDEQATNSQQWITSEEDLGYDESPSAPRTVTLPTLQNGTIEYMWSIVLLDWHHTMAVIQAYRMF